MQNFNDCLDRQIELINEKEKISLEDAVYLLSFKNMYDATGEKKFLDAVVKACDKCIDGEGNLTTDNRDLGRILFYAYDKTKEDKYHIGFDNLMVEVKKIDMASFNAKEQLLSMPFLMGFTSRFEKKEHYIDIASFLESYNPKDDELDIYLCTLVDTIGVMSMEIYEHYRKLQDLYKVNLKKLINSGRELSFYAYYSLLKAINLNLVLRDKYKDFAMQGFIKKSVNVDDAILGSAYSHYLIASKED